MKLQNNNRSLLAPLMLTLALVTSNPCLPHDGKSHQMAMGVNLLSLPSEILNIHALGSGDPSLTRNAAALSLLTNILKTGFNGKVALDRANYALGVQPVVSPHEAIISLSQAIRGVRGIMKADQLAGFQRKMGGVSKNKKLALYALLALSTAARLAANLQLSRLKDADILDKGATFEQCKWTITGTFFLDCFRLIYMNYESIGKYDQYMYQNPDADFSSVPFETESDGKVSADKSADNTSDNDAETTDEEEEEEEDEEGEESTSDEASTDKEDVEKPQLASSTPSE